jgi:hypothetical protein
LWREDEWDRELEERLRLERRESGRAATATAFLSASALARLAAAALAQASGSSGRQSALPSPGSRSG